MNFAYMATFSISHTCHMWRISDFPTSVIWRHLKFLHMWRNFQFLHNCHTWKANFSPHDNFFSTNIICDICDKYKLCRGGGGGICTNVSTGCVLSEKFRFPISTFFFHQILLFVSKDIIILFLLNIDIPVSSYRYSYIFL